MHTCLHNFRLDNALRILVSEGNLHIIFHGPQAHVHCLLFLSSCRSFLSLSFFLICCQIRSLALTDNFCSCRFVYDSLIPISAADHDQASRYLLTAHARGKRRALEGTGSNSPQIADLLCCIAFQITNQDHLRIGPFQSPSFSSNMRRKKLAGSGTEIASDRVPPVSQPYLLHNVFVIRLSNAALCIK